MSDPRSDAQKRSSAVSSSSGLPTGEQRHNDDSHTPSLSTRATQSHLQAIPCNPSSATKPAGSTLRANTALRPLIPQDTPCSTTQPQRQSCSTTSDRQVGSYDDGNLSTIGRGQANVSPQRNAPLGSTLPCLCAPTTILTLCLLSHRSASIASVAHARHNANTPCTRQARLSQSALRLLRYLRL